MVHVVLGLEQGRMLYESPIWKQSFRVTR